MREEVPKNDKVFSDAERARMLEDARRNEIHHRAMTGGDATENTQEVFDKEQQQRAIDEPIEGEIVTVPKKSHEERIRQLRESAGMTPEQIAEAEVAAEERQRQAFRELVKKDPRTGQKY